MRDKRLPWYCIECDSEFDNALELKKHTDECSLKTSEAKE